MSNTISNLLLTVGRTVLLVIAFIVFSAIFANTPGQVRAKNANSYSGPTKLGQPIYADYKGIRIGMSEQEVHNKLGQGTKVENSDFYLISDTETAQIAYDAKKTVIAISVDYANGVGAPDYKAVVGNDIETRADGSLYKIVHYDQLGFWVSYNRTGKNNPVGTVSITIQKVLR